MPNDVAPLVEALPRDLPPKIIRQRRRPRLTMGLRDSHAKQRQCVHSTARDHTKPRVPAVDRHTVDYNHTMKKRVFVVLHISRLCSSLFYSPFKKQVDDTLENADRASGERILGVDPNTGQQVLVRIGRFGPMAQLGKADDEDKKFSSLRRGQTLESITLDEALLLFKLPRKLGEYEGKVVSTSIGRFGPYVVHNSKFVSIKKDTDDDPYTLELDRAIELIEEKKAADAAALLKVFEEDETVRIINGRWGPFIKAGKKNVKIPKGEDYETIDWTRAQELIVEHDNKPRTKNRAPKAKKK